jgi:hypothetical protein
LKKLLGNIITNLKSVGISILPVEVTNISQHGIWLLANHREFFMSYQDFPWFKEAKVREIIHVKQLHTGHFYWPDLDVDLSINGSDSFFIQKIFKRESTY